MSNPFDQFAVDVQAALPSVGGPPMSQGGQVDPGNPFATVFVDAPSAAPPQHGAPKAVMNAPPMAMNGGGPPPPPMGQNNGYGGYDGGYDGGYGGGAGYGQPPMTLQQPPAPPMSMYGGGMEHQQQPPPMQMQMPQYGQPAPLAAPQGPPLASDPYGGGGGYGMAAPPSDPYASYGAMPPAGAPPASPNPYGMPSAALAAQPGPSPNPYGAPPPPMAAPSGVAPPFGGPYGGGAPVEDPYGGGAPVNDPYGGGGAAPPPPPASDPFGGYGAPPPPAAAANDPFGGGYGGPMAPAGPPLAPPASDPYGGYGLAMPPPASPNVYGAPPPPQQQQMVNPYAADPYGGGGGTDPFGGASLRQLPPYQDPGFGALVVSNQPNQPYAQLPPQHLASPPPPATDPFSVFNDAPAPAAPPSYALVPAQAPPPSQPQDTGDLWSDLGFDPPPTTLAVASNGQAADAAGPHVEEEKKQEGDLPPGGEFYDARIFTPTLGVMFFKPQELTDSLYLNTDRSLVDALCERPVVAFIVEGSSARSAGVELGHVLLKVNGVDVKNPKEASRLIKEGPRPLPLLFYVPSTDVVVAEGEHMVKYDTRETTAPNSAKDWKPKYVVIGGIIAQPWMMNMYRSKSEYDIAVIETQARRPVSVKVKQFSLQGARVQNDWQGPQMVKYKNKLHPWKYIVVLPVARNPIKISSPNLASLKPVHEGIRRVLLSQQRSRGGGGPTAAPVANRDPYSQQEYSQPPPPPQQQQQQQMQQQQMPPSQHQQQYSPNAGYAQPSGYTGGY